MNCMQGNDNSTTALYATPLSKARRYRQSPLEYAPATVSRPSRLKVTTFPRKAHGSKSARRYCQSPLKYAHATVSRPSRPKVTTLPHRTAGVQKRARLAPVPSRGRPCHGFAPLEAKRNDPSVTTFPRKTRGSKSARG